MRRGGAGSCDLLSAKVKSRKLEARIRRLVRRANESRAVGLARRQPGITTWGFLLVLLLPQLRVWEGPPEPPAPTRTEQEEWLQDRAEDAVKQVLRVIGHSVRIDEIEVRPLGPTVLARYLNGFHRIEITSDAIFSKDEMLETAAHECVHAIFDQSGVDGRCTRGPWASRQLVEETTAYVLGAHISGRVRSRQGGDGRALTRKLLGGYRDACDTSSPTGVYRRIWETQAAMGEDAVSPEREFSVSIHFGSTKLVDEIDVICKDHPDPWDAVLVIAETYLMPDREIAEKES